MVLAGTSTIIELYHFYLLYRCVFQYHGSCRYKYDYRIVSFLPFIQMCVSVTIQIIYFMFYVLSRSIFNINFGSVSLPFILHV